VIRTYSKVWTARSHVQAAADPPYLSRASSTRAVSPDALSGYGSVGRPHDDRTRFAFDVVALVTTCSRWQGTHRGPGPNRPPGAGAGMQEQGRRRSRLNDGSRRDIPVRGSERSLSCDAAHGRIEAGVVAVRENPFGHRPGRLAHQRPQNDICSPCQRSAGTAPDPDRRPHRRQADSATPVPAGRRRPRRDWLELGTSA
jgi:hypothetical protein